MVLLVLVLFSAAGIVGSFLLLGLAFVLRHFFGTPGTWAGTALLGGASSFLSWYLFDCWRQSRKSVGADWHAVSQWSLIAVAVPTVICFGLTLWMLRLALRK